MELEDLPNQYWHCYVAKQGQKRKKAVLNDLALDVLIEEIVTPWQTQAPFSVAGTVVADRGQVEEIRIVQTDRPKSFYADAHNASMSRSGIADMVTDRRLLPFNNGNDYTHSLLFAGGGARESDQSPDLGLVLRLCERLPNVARCLSNRDRGRDPFVVNDEYDVQDLLHALLRGYMKYSVQEEPLGKVAGAKSSRADFAIEDIGVIVEVKYARGPKDQAKMVQQFAEDVLLYSRWEHLKSFVYVVYNSSDLADPEALEELDGTSEVNGKRFSTHIVLA